MNPKENNNLPIHPASQFIWLHELKLGVTSFEHFLKDQNTSKKHLFSVNNSFYVRSSQNPDIIVKWYKNPDLSTKEIHYYQTNSSIILENWAIEMWVSNEKMRLKYNIE